MGRVAALSEYQSLARQASGLGVEGIARAYDFGIDANNGAPFSTAERIGWASLDRRVLAQGPLGVADLSRALSVLARALDAAHAAKVLHRDLKPQNVFISPDNPEWVRITDFGVSAVRRGAPEALGWGGPPGYTPPDAVDASAPGTPGVDLFALGVIAFFALTRATPFRSLRSPGFDPNAHWSELNQSLSPVSERAKEVGVALDPAFDPWFMRWRWRWHPSSVFTRQRRREMARELSAICGPTGAKVRGGGPRSMPGIAAAIAQPLVFQPEPSPASLGLAATVPTAMSPMAAQVAAPAPAPGCRDDALDRRADRRFAKEELGAARYCWAWGVRAVRGPGVCGGTRCWSKRSEPKPEPSAVASLSAALSVESLRHLPQCRQVRRARASRVNR